MKTKRLLTKHDRKKLERLTPAPAQPEPVKKESAKPAAPVKRGRNKEGGDD